MTVINPATGKEFRWARHRWTPRTRARWHKKTMDGKPVIGSVAAIACLDHMNRRAKAIYGREIEVLQSAYNNTVPASQGTHDLDMVYDLCIPGVGWWEQQRFYRAHGFWGWYRPTTPGLWNNHYHGFVARSWSGDPSKMFEQHGFKVGVYIDGGWSTSGRLEATSQVADFVAHAFGLKDEHTPGSDHSWFPSDLRGSIFDLNAYITRRIRVQAAA